MREEDNYFDAYISKKNPWKTAYKDPSWINGIRTKEWYRERKVNLLARRGSICIVCGNDNPNMLTFDHINPEEKIFTIGGNWSLPWKVLCAEADKCDIRCANHHLEKTIECGDTAFRKPVFIPYDYMLEDVS